MLEEDYAAGFRDAADDKVIPMWHEHFLGWPASEIEKAGIQIRRDVAITHFILQRTVDSGAGAAVKRSSRVTHTWIRDDPPMEDHLRHECRIQVINQRFFSYAQGVL